MEIFNLLAEILQALGVNATLWIHLLCFLVAFVAVSEILYKPYLRALQERKKRTVGSEVELQVAREKTERLKEDFQKEAARIHRVIHGIFQAEESKARQDSFAAIEVARTKIQEELHQSREQLRKNTQTARERLENDIVPLGHEVASSVAGREIQA